MSRSRPAPLTFLAVACLAGCTVGPNTSYIAALRQPADAEVLAGGMAVFVSLQLPAASTAIILDPPSYFQSGSVLIPALTLALRHHGFAVAEDAQPLLSNAHHVRYLVTPLDNGDLVRVTIDGSTEGSRLYVRNTAGGLQAGGPFTLTRAEAVR